MWELLYTTYSIHLGHILFFILPNGKIGLFCMHFTCIDSCNQYHDLDFF